MRNKDDDFYYRREGDDDDDNDDDERTPSARRRKLPIKVWSSEKPSAMSIEAKPWMVPWNWLSCTGTLARRRRSAKATASDVSGSFEAVAMSVGGHPRRLASG